MSREGFENPEIGVEQLSGWDYFLKCLRHYADFTGRARRSEYWYFALFSALVSFALSIGDLLMGLFSIEAGVGLLSGLFSLVIIIPSLAVFVRRLHDVGRSGWWFLIYFTIIGIFLLFYWLLKDSEPGDNRWGSNPKG
tara:strand:+ start:907 stop:1320 length:414 start_codon:yes stop_codon:yes gene_type:complete